MTARLETLACKIQERKKREQLQAELDQLFAQRDHRVEQELAEWAREFPRLCDGGEVL